MDDLDRKVLLLMCLDPRMPVKDLAKKLGVSRQAAHHRVQALARLGVFKKMTAEISFNSLGQVLVRVWGVSKSKAIEKTLDRLGDSEYTSDASVSGGNELSVLGCLPDISKLNGYVEFVRRAADIEKPAVGIISYSDPINPEWVDTIRMMGRENYRRPSLVDYRIVVSLREDVRKPLAKIASELGVSVRTVRRHLEAMRSDGLLDFHQVGDLTSGEEMVTKVLVHLRMGADKVKVGRRLMSLDPVHLDYIHSFGNLPNLLLCNISSDRMSEIRRLLKAIHEDDDVVAATPNLVYFERTYEPYDIKELLALGKPRKARKPTNPAKAKRVAKL